VRDDGAATTFKEGRPNEAAKRRLRRIKERLHSGWLKILVEGVVSNKSMTLDLDDETMQLINHLVDSVTSEVGRALVGLSILQLVVKALEPAQSVRLHKGGMGDFSWADGIPMRTLDTTYITPTLREYGLLRLNSYGFMMTRSLAENYPYSQFYKAAIRGAKKEWLLLVDRMEDRLFDPETALKYVIGLLANRSEKFNQLTDETIILAQTYNQTSPTLWDIHSLISTHIAESTYSARLLEVVMHSLLQVIEDHGSLEGKLLPLCQMRTANKKRRNVGDIEIVNGLDSSIVVEAWDAKFAKPYLRDELEELNDKLQDKPYVNLAGFVVDSEPDLRDEIRLRMEEIEEMTGAEVRILSLREWVQYWVERTGINTNKLGQTWLMAYVESLCQKRRDRAPVDEPSDTWVESLRELLRKGRRKTLQKRAKG
jgi:hypothetical protein